MDITNLIAQRDELNLQIKQAATQARSELIEHIRAVAEAGNFDLADIAADLVKVKKERAKRPPKYRHIPSGATWTGVGRAPKWYAETENVEAL